MKRLQFVTIIFLFFCCCSKVFAVPADPDTKVVIQPDGTQLNIQIRGDEHQNWHELGGTEYTVIQNKTTGYWEYAEKSPDGTLIPSNIKVEKDGRNAPSFIEKGIKPERNLDNENRLNNMIQEIYQERQNSLLPSEAGGPEFTWSSVPVSGQKKVLVILVNFANRKLVTTAAGWSNKIFNVADKSVAKFYYDNSFGKVSVSPASHTQVGNPAGIITVTVADNHPNAGSNPTLAVESAIINHALAKAAINIDFASYDTNGNGVIDTSELNIYLIFAGYDASGSTKTPNIWAHAWSGPDVSVAGKAVRHWALNGELNDSKVQHPMGVIAHELGHSMCGLPDLYDTSSTNQAMGNFSLMAGGSWGANALAGETAGGLTPVSLDAWSREFLAWTVPIEPDAPSTLQMGAALSATNAAYRLINRAVSSTEYFLLENRRPISWDLGLTKSLGTSWTGGMLITHIDNNVGTPGSNNINKYVAGGHQGVVPVQASTTYCKMLASGSSCRGHATTLFYSANKTSWTPVTTPNSNYYSGAQSSNYLNSISVPSTIMTGAYSKSGPVVYYSMSGTVKAGSATGSILAGATISIGGKTATTSSNGTFTLTGIHGGANVLTISKTGYTTYTQSAYVINSNQSGLIFYLSATLSNLTPYQPAGWSDNIVVTKTIGSTTDSGSLYTTDTLYVDWAVINNGDADIAKTFSYTLYVDGTIRMTWNSTSLPVGYYTYVTSYSIGKLTAGTHTIKITADPTNVVAEKNELDNSYTKTITVGTVATYGSLKITNATGENIAQLYVSPTSSATWGLNRITSAIPFTSYLTMTSLAANSYDIKVVLTSGANLYKYTTTVTGDFTTAVTFGNLGAIKVVNSSGVNINYLYISPTSSSTWGADQLGTSVLSSGYYVTYKAAAAAYDLKAVKATGVTGYIWNAILSAGSTLTATFY